MVEVVESFKLLEVTLDKNLTLQPHIKSMRKKANAKLFSMKTRKTEISISFFNSINLSC